MARFFLVFAIGCLGFIRETLAAPPVLPAAEAARLLEKTRAISREYARSLPDFICTETARRYIELPKPKIWQPLDTLTFQLSYSPEGESRKLVLVDGIPADEPASMFGGLQNVGEFGGMLQGIFEPAAEARFQWEGWTTVRGRAAASYRYAIEVSHSMYMLSHGTPALSELVLVGVRGTVVVDRATGQVLHMVYQAADVPKDFPTQYASTTVDYAWADAGGQRCFLPLRSEIETRSGLMHARNIVEFRDYQKFTSESSIRFELRK
jgi:hypothetical protein